MSRFDALTKYIPMIAQDDIGHLQIDRVNDGTLEHPKQFPFVAYSAMIDRFVDDVYALVDQYPEWNLNHYGQILEDNGLQWNQESMSGAIVEDLDARCICALLVGAVRAERFCDGALLGFFKDGSISRWLQRLKDIDETQIAPFKRIQITSDGICYGPCPEPDEEVEQRLTIHRDGRVWFVGYNFGVCGKYVQGRKTQCRIEKESADKLFVAFEKFFSEGPMLASACDIGDWEITLTDSNGDVQKFRSAMTGGYEIDGVDLSELARTLLPIEDLWVFDRIYAEE